jgi:hypothetical protein
VTINACAVCVCASEPPSSGLSALELRCAPLPKIIFSARKIALCARDAIKAAEWVRKLHNNERDARQIRVATNYALRIYDLLLVARANKVQFESLFTRLLSGPLISPLLSCAMLESPSPFTREGRV